MTTWQIILGILTLVGVCLFFIYIGYHCAQAPANISGILYAAVISLICSGFIIGCLVNR